VPKGETLVVGDKGGGGKNKGYLGNSGKVGGGREGYDPRKTPEGKVGLGGESVPCEKKKKRGIKSIHFRKGIGRTRGGTIQG